MESSEKLKRQLQMIEFIRESISNAEGEEYFVKRVNFYHPNYTIFGDYFYIGSLLVICNGAYNDLFTGYGPNRFLYGPWAEGGNPDWERAIDSDVLKVQQYKHCTRKSDDERKAIFIKTSYAGGSYNLKKLMRRSQAKAQFPYIIESVDCLTGNSIYEGDINKLMEDLSQRMTVPTTQNVKEKIGQ